jgi:hypothetical protein
MKIPEIMTHQPWNNKEIWNNVCGTFRFLFVKKSGDVGIVLPWTYDNLIYIYLCNQSLIPELYFWEMIWKYVFASSVTHSWSRSDYSLFITRTSTCREIIVSLTKSLLIVINQNLYRNMWTPIICKEFLSKFKYV